MAINISGIQTLNSLIKMELFSEIFFAWLSYRRGYIKKSYSMLMIGREMRLNLDRTNLDQTNLDQTMRNKQTIYTTNSGISNDNLGCGRAGTGVLDLVCMVSGGNLARQPLKK